MSTPVTNFGKSTVSLGYSSGATSIVLSSGGGSRFPSTFPYPLVWWNSTDYADPADDPDREIVLVTTRTGDTLTVTRAQESTSASNKNLSGKTYTMVESITKAMWDGIGENALSQSFRGLSLQTHTDSDKALAQVRLVHADAIVMDDGQEVLDWNDLDASLAAAGIGGLDTGSEVASTWYQVIAGYNPVTLAKGIYFHRAKDYLLDEDITAGEDASQGVRSAVDNSTVRVAQGFQLGTAGLVEFVDVKLLKTGTPTGNYWFTIEANSGGVPSNTPLATSDKLDVARLTTTATVVRLPFRTPASLSAATQYHLVMYGDYTVSAANFASWRMDGSAAAYASGSKALYDSDTTTWTTDTDDDMWCRIYVTRNDTALTKPSGYTQAALIGWAYNDSGSNLLKFDQFNYFWQYHVCTDGLFVNEGLATIVLHDLRVQLPPITCEAQIVVTGTGAALGSFYMEDFRGTDVGAGGYTSLGYTSSTGESFADPVEMVLPYNGLMTTGTAGVDGYIGGFRW